MPASFLFWRVHHRHGVPADEGLDAALELAVAGVGNFVFGGMVLR